MKIFRSQATPALRPIAILTIAALAATSACNANGEAGDGGASDAPRALRIGQVASPENLDPALGGGQIYAQLAYDSLFYAAPDGTFEPALVESWTASDGNKQFTVKIREGVLFSDGSPLTADVVKQNVEYYLQTNGPTIGRLPSVFSSVDVMDENTLHFTFSKPEPLFPQLFSETGRMICPAALESPETLATQTCGAGQYVLDTDRTVVNDTYTYVPNPHYWNPDARHWSEVIVKVLPDDNTRLSALTTGQVDIIVGQPDMVDAAESSGMDVAAFSSIILGLMLNDRQGKLNEPLADMRVRQALNYAVDRDSLAAALGGEYSVPTEQMSAPGQVGHNDDQFYDYDLEKAQDLLAQAGYPDGFDLPVFTTPFVQRAVEAIAGELERVGVNLKIQVVEDAAYFESLPKYPAAALGWGVTHPFITSSQLWLPGATIDPFTSNSDAVIEDLHQRAQVADESAQGELFEEMIGRLVELAWFLPVMINPQFLIYAGDEVEVESHIGGNYPDPTSWRPLS